MTDEVKAIDPVIETELDDKEESCEKGEEQSRWSYFAVKEITQEFSSKVDVKKWLVDNGVDDHKIIRGRILPTGEKVVRRITLG